MRSRRFVLLPLLELDPALALPDGTRLKDALDALGKGQEARLYSGAAGARRGSVARARSSV